MNKKGYSRLYFERSFKQLLKSKRSAETIGTEAVIFLVLNLLFFSILLFFVIRSGSPDTALEETYAKKIALVLDEMKPGMEVNISAEDFFSRFEKNNIQDFPIPIANSKVTVKISKTGGYSFYYFSKVDPRISINKELKLINIKT